MAGTIHARRALTADGWRRDVVVAIDDDGLIADIGSGGFDAAQAVGTLLPGMSNCHTHSFQRAMAGLAEHRATGASAAEHDDFWSWRKVMYRFLEILTPDDIEAIAAQVQMHMAEAGYTASAEFHYVHHQHGGAPYEDVAETSARIMAASRTSGIGLTHLPVLYTFAGMDRAPLAGGQMRFGNDVERFARLHERTAELGRDMPGDFRLGVAPHSLRAVDEAGLEACRALSPEGPVHIHAAEQVREVADVEAALGARPVRWLLDNAGVDARWCLIHATHMDAGEVADLAASGAVAGLCPTTEANLGDGIFPARAYLSGGGRIAIGSDSNIRISVAEELRMLEVSQRLHHRERVVLADATCASNGRNLFERAARGGAQAIGRNAGALAVGWLADCVALRDDSPFLDWSDPDRVLDSWIFGVEGNPVSDVWSAGRHIVRQGRHVARDAISAGFGKAMARLQSAL